ncbi:MAG TPA: UGSC family (seleno)protein [Methylomirabilota bacterium]|nr:UGSC family (seleno)protein [Methylomirabilota bacterium]
MTIEARYGVPTVALHTDKFDRVVRSVAAQNGMAGLRQAFVPQPVMGKTARELRAYVDGQDPITKRPVMQEVIEGLTRPFAADEEASVEYDRSTPRLVEPDTEENLHRLFLQNHWTDTLPIVLPTEERVAAMLAATHRRPDEVVGHMRPTHFREAWEYTVEKVAVNAVMAGASPRYFPVILALAASGVSARGSSSSSLATMAVVNGPVRDEIEMNSGTGALGPYNHANATIGRAYGLLSQNLQGGSVPGLTYMGSMGNNYAYNSVTFAENQERSPWEPFHVQHGFRPTDSTVSVFTGCRSTAFTLGLREKHWREHVRNMLRGLDPHTPPVLLLDPITAWQFVDRGGFLKKDALIDWLYETATMAAGEYWDYQLVQNYIYPRATFGEEPWASKLKAAPDELIPMFRREDIHVVVVGGETNGYWRIMGSTYQTTTSLDAWR